MGIDDRTKMLREQFECGQIDVILLCIGHRMEINSKFIADIFGGFLFLNVDGIGG